MYPPSIAAPMSKMPPGFQPRATEVNLSELAARSLFEPKGGMDIEDWKKTVLRPLFEKMMAGASVFHQVEVIAERALESPAKAPPEVVFIVLDGAIEEWQGPLRACTHRCGSVVWANFAIAGKAVCTKTVVRSDARLLPVLASAFKEAMKIHGWLMERVLERVSIGSVDYADDEEQYGHAFDRELIGGTGAIIPGPFIGDVEMFSFFVKGAKAKFERELPPGVRWRQIGGIDLPAAIVFARFLKANHANVDLGGSPYDELNLFLPVTVTPDQGAPFDALHVARMFPDNGLMVALGREISGFPKVSAATSYDYLGFPSSGTYRLQSRFGDSVLAEVRLDHPKRWSPFTPPGPGKPFVSRVPNASSFPPPSTWPISQTLSLLGLAATGSGLCNMQPVQMATTAWKRIFSPGAQYTATKQEWVPWEAKDFSIDATVKTPMTVEPVLSELDVITLVRKPYFDRSVFGDIDVIMPPGTNLRMGTYMLGKLTQLASSTEVDYLTPTYQSMPTNAPERQKLQWGFPPPGP